MRSLLWISVLSAALAGCFADGGVRVHAAYVVPPPPVAVVSVQAEPAPQPVYEANAEVDDAPYVEPTSMVYVNPDVQVIEDYDYPVFFTGGLYWRNDGGVWYSSSWHDRGWATNYNPPMVVAHIDRPEGYVHYHANVHATVGQPGYRNPHVTAVVHPSAPPPRNVVPSHPVQARPAGHPIEQRPMEAGHGPVVRPNEAHPSDQRPMGEPAHANEGGHMPAGYEPGKEAGHPAAAPTHEPMATHEPALTHETKTGGTPPAPKATPPSKQPYKAPPPAPKKKK